MQPASVFSNDHPFVQICMQHGCVLYQDAAGTRVVVSKNDTSIVFHGDIAGMPDIMAQKRYRQLLKKMLYLAQLGVSPVFRLDRPLLWTERMLELECDRMMDPTIILNRFFEVPHKLATNRMQEGPNVLACGFKPVGIRYSCEGKNELYSLEIALAHNCHFFRRVYTLQDIADTFNMPLDVLGWLGDAGSLPWWKGLQEQAMRNKAPILEMDLEGFEFG